MPRQGTTKARGYSGRHQSIRNQVKRVVDAGGALCVRCGLVIDPFTAWDLDHTEDRTGYNGPAHATCNRRAGGRKSRRNSVLRRWVL